MVTLGLTTYCACWLTCLSLFLHASPYMHICMHSPSGFLPCSSSHRRDHATLQQSSPHRQQRAFVIPSQTAEQERSISCFVAAQSACSLGDQQVVARPGATLCFIGCVFGPRRRRMRTCKCSVVSPFNAPTRTWSRAIGPSIQACGWWGGGGAAGMRGRYGGRVSAAMAIELTGV